MFAVVSPSSSVPVDHQLRQTKVRADAELKELSPVFDSM